jgi:hypothetical protein
VPVIESAVTLLAMGKFKEPVPIQMTVSVNSKSDLESKSIGCKAYSGGYLLKKNT